ncbi:hypothetical protein ABKN59_005620 [Abortiporus biennis]
MVNAICMNAFTLASDRYFSNNKSENINPPPPQHFPVKTRSPIKRSAIQHLASNFNRSSTTELPTSTSSTFSASQLRPNSQVDKIDIRISQVDDHHDLIERRHSVTWSEIAVISQSCFNLLVMNTYHIYHSISSGTIYYHPTNFRPKEVRRKGHPRWFAGGVHMRVARVDRHHSWSLHLSRPRFHSKLLSFVSHHSEHSFVIMAPTMYSDHPAFPVSYSQKHPNASPDSYISSLSPAQRLPSDTIIAILKPLLTSLLITTLEYSPTSALDRDLVSPINESQSALCHALQVCSNWYTHGTQLLYTHPHLCTPTQIRAFSRTIMSRPDLAHMVKNVYVMDQYRWFPYPPDSAKAWGWTKLKEWKDLLLTRKEITNVLARCSRIDNLEVFMRNYKRTTVLPSLEKLLCKESIGRMKLRRLCLFGYMRTAYDQDLYDPFGLGGAEASPLGVSTFTPANATASSSSSSPPLPNTSDLDLPTLEVLTLREVCFGIPLKLPAFKSLPKLHTLQIARSYGTYPGAEVELDTRNMPSLENIEFYHNNCSFVFDESSLQKAKRVVLVGEKEIAIFATQIQGCLLKEQAKEREQTTKEKAKRDKESKIKKSPNNPSPLALSAISSTPDIVPVISPLGKIEEIVVGGVWIPKLNSSHTSLHSWKLPAHIKSFTLVVETSRDVRFSGMIDPSPLDKLASCISIFGEMTNSTTSPPPPPSDETMRSVILSEKKKLGVTQGENGEGGMGLEEVVVNVSKEWMRGARGYPPVERALERLRSASSERGVKFYIDNIPSSRWITRRLVV